MKTITLQFTVSDDTNTARLDGARFDTADVQAFLHSLDRLHYARQLTDKDIADVADGNAQRAYAKTVQGFVDDLKSEIKDGTITDSEGAREYLEQSIDGCHDVIYTYTAQEVCRQSSNDGAYFDDFGSEGAITDSGIEWSKLAYCALLADVMEEIGDLDDLFTDDEDDEDEDTATKEAL